MVGCVGGSELGAVDRQAEGDLDHGFGWLGVLVGLSWRLWIDRLREI